MALPPEYSKTDHAFNMRMTLQSLISIEFFMLTTSYYLMTENPMPQWALQNYNIFYSIWLFALTLTIIPAIFAETLNLALIRLVYRTIHYIVISAVLFINGVMLIPTIHVFWYVGEHAYLVYGTRRFKMDYPGKWIVDLCEKYEDYAQKTGMSVVPMDDIKEKETKEKLAEEKECSNV